MHAYMSVLVWYMSISIHVCMGIYMYVKGHCGCIQMQCVHIQIYVYISGFVRVCVCVWFYTYMYEKTSCVHTECGIQKQAYMSVFASCLQVCLICVCRYLHIYMYARKTPRAYTDTLCAHRNTCIRMCVCVCVYVYTCIHIYMKRHRVCIRIYICVCIYCIYARQLHTWVCRCLDVCMCV